MQKNTARHPSQPIASSTAVPHCWQLSIAGGGERAQQKESLVRHGRRRRSAGAGLPTRDADAAAAEARILARLAACVACAVPCRDHVARCKGVAPCREVMPRVVLAWWTDRMKRVADMLALGKSSPLIPHAWVPVVWRPAWGARWYKGRACRDPRKRATTCKVMP